MIRAALVLLVALLLGPAGAQAKSWFSLRPDAAAAWSVTETADRVTLNRVGQAGDGRRIVVLYARASSAYETAMSRILDIVVQKHLAPTIEVMLADGGIEEGLAAVRRAEAADAGLIIAMGSEIVEFLAHHYRNGRLPVLTVCAKDPVMLGHLRDYETGSGTNIAFTSLNLPIDTLLAYVTRLRPGLKGVGILVDASNLSAMQTQAAPLAAALRQRGVGATMISIDSPAAARAQLHERIPRAVAQMRQTDPTLSDSVLLITGSTAVFSEIDTINAAAGTLPVLSMVPDVVGPGDSSAVLSIGVSFDSNAHLAALYAIDILYGGVKPGTMKVGVVSPPDIGINFKKAREIGMRIPFPLFEMASRIYDGEGREVRRDGLAVRVPSP
jgi:putative ABC transport system substrate-binding protein